MTFDRPWALALLVVPVVLLWLRLRAQRPREAEASSLLVWQKVSPADAAPARPRPPLAAWLEAAGVVLLVAGLADPGMQAADTRPFRVLLDRSPSMESKRKDGMTRIEYARSLVVSESLREIGNVERDLPGWLGSGSAVVFVTDHRIPGFEDIPGGFQMVGVGDRGWNAGITMAATELQPLGTRQALVSIEAHGSSGPVQGRLRIGPKEESITVSPGAKTEIVRDIPGSQVEVQIEFPGDVLPADDRAIIPSFVEVPLAASDDPDLAPVVRALEAAGAVRQELGPLPPRTIALGFLTLRFPPPGGGDAVRGDRVVATGHPLARGVSVDPTGTLGARRAAPPPGEPILVDEIGPLVSATYDSPVFGAPAPDIHFALVPGGTWAERDPSFVVFAKNLVECSAKVPVELVTLGVLDPKETREAAEGETFGDLAKALEEARRPDPAARAPLAAAFLFAAAGLLGAAWWVRR